MPKKPKREIKTHAFRAKISFVGIMIIKKAAKKTAFLFIGNGIK